MTSDAKTVRGLSIATVVLSALSILAALLGLAAMAAFGAVANDPSFIAEFQNELQGSAQGNTNYFDDDYYYYQELGNMDASFLISTILGLGVFAMVWGLVCSAVPLVSGILGIRNCAKHEKLNSTFVWAIVGAVTSLLMGNLITMALLIISAVYLNKLKKAPAEPPYGSASQQPYGYGQPYGYNPQQPYGNAPQQPASFQQPPYGQPGPYNQQPAPWQQPATPNQQAPYENAPANDPSSDSTPHADDKPQS